MDRKVNANVIASMGNFVQGFDNTLFSVLLPLIIYNFVPKEAEGNQIFIFLITYVGTLFTKPFGAFIFSHFSDHYSRKKVLVITAFAMGCSTLFLGLCPPVNMVGVAAPAFLLLFIALYGFSSGGEWPCTTTYLYETNDTKTYPSAGLIAALSTILGMLIGNILITLLLSVKSEAFIGGFSWRVLFLISSILAFMSVKLRMGLQESPLWHQPVRPFRVFTVLASMKKELLLSFILTGVEAVGFALFFNAFYPFTSDEVNRAYQVMGTFIAFIFSYILYQIVKRLGARATLKLGVSLLAVLALIQFIMPDEVSFGYYRLLYVLPTFLYFIPLSMKIPSLFNVTNRAFGVAVSRNFSVLVLGGVGLIMMRLFFKAASWIIATYILSLSLMSWVVLIYLSKKRQDIF